MSEAPAAEPRESRRDVALFYLVIAGVGVLTGLAAAALHGALDLLDQARIGLAAALADRPMAGLPVAAAGGAGMVTLSVWLVRRFAPESAGSGIPEVIAALREAEPLRWRRLIPVKFLGGVLGIGSGLVLGREGPTIHLGGAVGAMLAELGRLGRQGRFSAITAGAGAGLAAAFNAPLAGIVFVTEEMRRDFDFSFRSFQAVILACVIATIVNDQVFGVGPQLVVPDFVEPLLPELLLFVPLGVLIGGFGVAFNAGILHRVRLFGGLPERRPLLWAGTVGAVVGCLVWYAADLTGGGEGIIVASLDAYPGLGLLVGLILVRTVLLVASYSTGVPGGLFAPMLSLGTAIGLAFGIVAEAAGLTLGTPPGTFAVAAMGALFAATVRAPLTGIVVVIEMTANYNLILAIVVTSLVATFTAEALGGKPIYGQLLKRALGRQARREGD